MSIEALASGQGMMGWKRGVIAIVVVLAALTWQSVRMIRTRGFRAELAQARQMLDRGRYNAASASLSSMAKTWPQESEVHYLLGLANQGLGRLDEAALAWSRVPAQSNFGMESLLRRAHLEMARGKFADAEAILMSSSRDPRREAIGARQLLAELLWLQLRYDEVIPLFESNWKVLAHPDWPRPSDAVDLVRSHITADLFPLPIESIRSKLDRARSLAPDDDRVWLGRANLAIRSGQYAEAEKLLDACARRRPEDPAVWQARLNCAMGAGRPDEARRAIAKIPDDCVAPARVAEIAAWFAGRGADDHLEKRELERLIEIDPGHSPALERLAELAIRANQPDRARSLRQRKAELDSTRHRYKNLLEDGGLKNYPREMARLAEAMGRRFEAQALYQIAARGNPQDQELAKDVTRTSGIDRSFPSPGARLSERMESLMTEADSVVEQARLNLPRFEDVAESAQLSFTFANGESELHQLPEMASGGVGLLDFDGDGWLDIYLVQGGPFPPDPGTARCGDRLYRNIGKRGFHDVTKSAGLPEISRGYGHGVTIGDIDNDGHSDIFVTRWRGYALYRNKGNGTFEDVTSKWGLAGEQDWPTSAAFADLDGDGDLDLYVCHYGVWDPVHPRLCESPATKGYVTCDPHLVESRPDRLFRNDGGCFVDVTADAGIVDKDGRGLGVVAADLDDDGRLDLYVANDGTANFLFRNLGGFRFEEIGHLAGVASNAEGGYQAGMGVACGDLDGDGRPDLAVTNFFGESTTFYRNLGDGQFADHTASIGLAAPSRYLLGFGIAMVDVNNDGHLDLMTANGHVGDYRPQAPYWMPLQLLLGTVEGMLTDVSAQSGSPFQLPHLGRGMAAGDLDNDGWIDALVVVQNERVIYLHNRTEKGHFLTLRLEGVTSNRDALGARVTVESGGRRQVGQRIGGGSYQSAGDPRLHFGLGLATRVDRVEVRWPSGSVAHYSDLVADRAYLLRENSPAPVPLSGWDR